MKVKIAALLVLTTGCATVAVGADSYTVDSNHTWPVFEVKHLGFSTQRGRFNKSTGKIKLDQAAKQGSVDLKIETASIDMGFQKWDDHLKSPEFFDAAKFPDITFKSNKLKFEGDNVVGADGDLTVHGVTKPVSLAVAGFRCGEHPVMKGKTVCGADITGTIKRSEFGMEYGLPAISDEVKLIIPVEAMKD
jgi:polyisoprenoid-binding protein YceI